MKNKTKRTALINALFLTLVLFSGGVSCSKRAPLAADTSEIEIEECVPRTESGTYTGQYCSTSYDVPTAGAVATPLPSSSPIPSNVPETTCSYPEGSVKPRFEVNEQGQCLYCDPVFNSYGCLVTVSCNPVSPSLCQNPPDGLEVIPPHLPCPPGATLFCDAFACACTYDHSCSQGWCPQPTPTPSPSASPQPTSSPSPSPTVTPEEPTDDEGNYHLQPNNANSCSYNSTFSKIVCGIYNTYIKDDKVENFSKYINESKEKKNGAIKDKLVVKKSNVQEMVIQKTNKKGEVKKVVHKKITYDAKGKKTNTQVLSKCKGAKCK